MNKKQSYIAMHPDGITDIEVSSDIGLKVNGTDCFTLESWFCTPDVNTRQVLFKQEEVFNMGVEGGRLFLSIKGYPLLTSDAVCGNIGIDQWTHICIVYNQAQFFIYINGVFNRFVSVTGKSTGNVSKPFVKDKEWKGEIRKLRILNIAAEADQVRSYMFKDDIATTSDRNIAVWYDFSGEEPVEKISGLNIAGARKLQRCYTPCIEFASDEASVQIEHIREINPGGFDNAPYTISAIVYFIPVQSQDVYILFSNRQTDNDDGVVLSIEKKDGVFRVKSSYGSHVVVSTAGIPPMKWVEIKTVYKDNQLQIYMDEQECGKKPLPAPVAILYKSRRVCIGCESSAQAEKVHPFRGAVSEFSIYRGESLCAHYSFCLNDYKNSIDALPALPHPSVRWKTISEMLPGVEMAVTGNYSSQESKWKQTNEIDDWWITYFYQIIQKTIKDLFGIEITDSQPLCRFIKSNLIEHPVFKTLPSTSSENTAAIFWKECSETGLLPYLVDSISEIGIFQKIWLIQRLNVLSATLKGYTDIEKDLMLALKKHIDCKPSGVELTPVGLSSILPVHDEMSSIPLRRNLWEQYPDAWTPRNQDKPLALLQDKMSEKGLILKATFNSCCTQNFSFYAKVESDLWGDSDYQTITMRNGKSEPTYATFSLKVQSGKTPGVRIEKGKLEWKCSTDKVKWQTIFKTELTIYVLLASPNQPWTAGEEGGMHQLQWPWTDVLDKTCCWAEGKKTAHEVVWTVTNHINNGIGLKYDTQQGVAHYIDDKQRFRLTAFLQYMNTDKESCIVNSTDCATIVTTLANITGCHLAEKMIGWNFQCNKIIFLGDTAWRKPFAPSGENVVTPGMLPFHETAMNKGEAWKQNNDYQVYDASLQIDGSSSPDDDQKIDSLRKALLPAGIRFSAFPDGQSHCPEIPVEDSYREHLAANNVPEGIAKCLYDTTTTYNEDEDYQYKPVI